MQTSRASTRRAALAAFLLFAAGLFVVGPADASRTTDARSSLAPLSAQTLAPSSSRELTLLGPASLELASLELASLELPTLEPLASVDTSPRLGFAEDLTLLDIEARPCGFELVGGVGTRRYALTYARNNPVNFIDPFGLMAECVGTQCTDSATVTAADPGAEAARRFELELRLMRARAASGRSEAVQSVSAPQNQFPLYDWASFGTNSLHGVEAWADGLIPVWDPFASCGAYDPNGLGMDVSQISGQVSQVALGQVAALRVAAGVGGTRIGHALNHNRYLRIGPGRMPRNGRLPAGSAVPRMSIGPQRPGVSNPHFDLRFGFFR